MTSTFNTISANKDIYNKYDTNIELIIGEIIMFPKVYNKSNLSNNIELLLCNGSSYSTSDYPELYAVIANTYTTTSTNGMFNVPNMDERVIKCYDSTNDSSLTTKYGGNSTISTNQFTHSHSLSYSASGTVSQTVRIDYSQVTFSRTWSDIEGTNSNRNGEGRYNDGNAARSGHSHNIIYSDSTFNITPSFNAVATSLSENTSVSINTTTSGQNTSNQQSYIPKSSKIAFYIVAKI